MNIRQEYICETKYGWTAMGTYFPAATLALAAVHTAAIERNREIDQSEGLLIKWIPTSANGYVIARLLDGSK